MLDVESGKGSVEARRRPLRQNGENKFLKMKFSKQETNQVNDELKKTSKVDDNVAPMERGERKSSLVEVECRECGYIYDVTPEMVPPGDSLGYMCDDCIVSMGSKG